MALRTRIVFRWTNLLLLAIPASFVAQQQQWGTGTVFVLLVLSTIPLAGFIAAFTDALANSAGGKWGEIFEAIFGNATFIILGIQSLSLGLVGVVQASIAGALICNTLFVLGTAFFIGNMGRSSHVTFSDKSAQDYAKILALIIVALVLPAVAEQATPKQTVTVGASLITAVVLLVFYVTYVLHEVFHIFDHTPTVNTPHTIDPNSDEILSPLAARSAVRLHPVLALPGLVAAVVATFYLSGLLTQATQTVVQGAVPLSFGPYSLGTIHFSQTFVGLVIYPIVGSLAENINVIKIALDDKSKITVANTAGTAVQISLLASPVFVLVSYVVFPASFFSLLFTRLEIVVIALATFLYYLVTEDGVGTWLEGMLLLGGFVIFAAIAFLT